MFRINYVITDDLEDIKQLDAETFDLDGDLDGYFELNFNNNLYGYCNYELAEKGIEGNELITSWFERLLLVYLSLQKSNYVLLNDIESYNTWIQFNLFDMDKLSVSIIEHEKPSGTGYVETVKFQTASFPDWQNIVIDLMEYKEEVISKTLQYIKEIEELNSKLLHSNRIKRLNGLLDECLGNS